MNLALIFRKPKLLRALTSLDLAEFARLEAGLEELLAAERQEHTHDGAKRQRAYGAGNVGKLPSHTREALLHPLLLQGLPGADGHGSVL